MAEPRECCRFRAPLEAGWGSGLRPERKATANPKGLEEVGNWKMVEAAGIEPAVKIVALNHLTLAARRRIEQPPEVEPRPAKRDDKAVRNYS